MEEKERGEKRVLGGVRLGLATRVSHLCSCFHRERGESFFSYKLFIFKLGKHGKKKVGSGLGDELSRIQDVLQNMVRCYCINFCDDSSCLTLITKLSKLGSTWDEMN